MEFNSEVHNLQCPKCSHGMEEVTHGNVTIDRCTHCKGIWFDAEEAQDLRNIDGAEELEISIHRSLAPVLKKLRKDGYRLIGLEQTTNSTSMHSYSFARRTVLVVGNERTGLTDEILELLDDVVEIPVYGLPHSFNAATAASMALYEYCRQFPNG